MPATAGMPEKIWTTSATVGTPATAVTPETIGSTTATVGMSWIAVKSGTRTKQYTDASKSREARDNRDGKTAATSGISATAGTPEIIGTATATPCTVKKG